MPLYEYKCSEGHITEHYFHNAKYSPDLMACSFSFNKAKNIEDADLCGADAEKIISTQFLHTYGEGFYKQSEIGPVVNKQDVTKVAKEFNVYDKSGQKVSPQHMRKLSAQVNRLSKAQELKQVTRKK